MSEHPRVDMHRPGNDQNHQKVIETHVEVAAMPMLAVSESRTAKRRRRGQGRPFTPGVSGNPGGRPVNDTTTLKEMARERTERALKVLDEALDSKDERVRISAANALLDRGWGKPASVDEAEILRATMTAHMEELSDEALAAIAARGGKKVPDVD